MLYCGENQGNGDSVTWKSGDSAARLAGASGTGG